ncbi:MAG: aminoacyl-tRNA hydrolase [Bacteriovoracaceae bacterium]|nr:aminoacyl-tRNA hydrolase [Bacteriovoracaceae bacterium]
MIKIPYSEFSFSFSRSSGAGGQNVNKVNSKATLEWDMESSSVINRGIKDRFKEKYRRFIVNTKVVMTSQRQRSQNQNIDDCIAKLHELLLSVEFPPKKRKATKPTRGSVKRRLDGKKMDSIKKKLRREKF